MKDDKQYLVVLSVSNERDPRFALMKTQAEAQEYIEKLQSYLSPKGVELTGYVFRLCEPVLVM